MISPANSGRPQAKANSTAPSPNGIMSSSNAGRPARRERAMRRGSSHARAARPAPAARCSSASAPIGSGGADVEAEIAHDAVADHRRGEIAKAHAEHQRPRKIDARPAAIDAALDAPGGALPAP